VKKALVGFLALNALLQLVVAFMLLASPARAVPAMFAVAYDVRMGMPVSALGMSVAVSAALLGLAIPWTQRGDVKGLQLAALFGLWSCAAGAMFLWGFGQAGGLFDLLRGVVIVVLAFGCAADLRRTRPRARPL